MGPFPPRAADNGGPALALVRGVHSARTKQVYYHEIADETKRTKKIFVRRYYAERAGCGLQALFLTPPA